MIEIQAPNRISERYWDRTVFLAGSIEMGKAERWQDEVIGALIDLPIVIANPRRDDWDSSWEQTIENEQFTRQVRWELNALDKCALIALYFDPTTKAPISLLELGLYIGRTPMVVYCPTGFWRKGNVDIVIEKFSSSSYVHQAPTWDYFIERIQRLLEYEDLGRMKKAMRNEG